MAKFFCGNLPEKSDFMPAESAHKNLMDPYPPIWCGQPHQRFGPCASVKPCLHAADSRRIFQPAGMQSRAYRRHGKIQKTRFCPLAGICRIPPGTSRFHRAHSVPGKKGPPIQAGLSLLYFSFSQSTCTTVLMRSSGLSRMRNMASSIWSKP